MKPKMLIVLYFIALAVECLAILVGSTILHFVSKPLLMPVLALYLYSSTSKSSPARHLILGALAFSWIGDIVLMLDKLYGSLFIYGLIGFLGAHVCYLMYFLRIRKINTSARSHNIVGSLLVFGYMATFYVFLYPGLGGLKIPVLIYAIFITLMLLSSLRAFDLRSQVFGRICVMGTLIFAVSDSVLAINRFAAPFEYASLFIMVTYAVAQFLIVEGARSVPPAVAGVDRKQ
jgi:uncharacterized membrane protein YhhN